MDHTEERHYETINSLCRVCGNLTNTCKNKKAYKKPYLVEKISDQLRIICGEKKEEEKKSSELDSTSYF